MSHFHYFLESQFGFTNVRDADFTYCKNLLNYHLVDPESLYYMTSNQDDDPEFVIQIRSFNCYTEQVQVYNVP